MRERNDEVLFPDGELGVGDDAGSSHGGAGDDDADVRVTGDDIVMAVALIAGRREDFFFARSALEGGLAGSEAQAESLREGVHVR